MHLIKILYTTQIRKWSGVNAVCDSCFSVKLYELCIFFKTIHFPCFAQAEALESLLEENGDNQITLDKRASIIPRVNPI